MNIGAMFGAGAELALAWQPRQRPFHDPSNFTQSGPVRGLSPRDPGSNPTTPQPLAVRLRVIGTVRIHLLRSATGPTPFAANRRDRVDQRFQLLDIGDVDGSDGRRQGDAIGIDDDVVLTPLLPPVYGAGAGLLPPPTARSERLATETRDQPIWPAPFNSARRVSWSLLQTLASCQSRSRRQQVIPLPQPISWGRSSHAIPVFKTNRMPVNALRSSTCFRPG